MVLSYSKAAGERCERNEVMLKKIEEPVTVYTSLRQYFAGATIADHTIRTHIDKRMEISNEYARLGCGICWSSRHSS